MAHVLIVGSGVFGTAAALALRGRGYEVTLAAPGPRVHPETESIDINKAIRMDYGADEAYAALMEDAIDGWRRWNAAWPTPLFHETGVAYLSRAPMAPGGFEHDSFATLTRRGHRLERLDAEQIRRRFPAWSTGAYVDGYFNPVGGFAESGEVVSRLLASARDQAVDVKDGFVAARIVESAARVIGVEDAEGSRIVADYVVVACGAWVPQLVPSLAPHIISSAQPVFCLRPADPRLFEDRVFPTFGADIAKTGYYGFPYLRIGAEGGWVKIANHGPGRVHPAGGPRLMPSRDEIDALRAFLRATFPLLADAPIALMRTCSYGDTRDGHFWIAPDPERSNLIVATGGSGHAFKFAPLLGDWIADAVEGKIVNRFRWRTEITASGNEEAARQKGAHGREAEA